MTIHPMVLQLRFCRVEFKHALEGVTPEEAVQRFMPMNCISWTIAHLASQEQRYWLMRGKGITLIPEVNKLAGSGQPASTPPLDWAWEAWSAITEATNDWLDTLTSETLKTFMEDSRRTGKFDSESIGSRLRRVSYHYYYHIGETQAIRQLLGHKDLSVFVGDIHEEAPYTPESMD
jgi:hypothetical protein